MRALVVYAHPDPESFAGAVLARAVRGLERAGHEVRVTDLYADGFDGAMTADERLTHKEPGVGPDLQRHADDLRWAELLVLVYPTWWSGFPAILKGWVDRVWVAGVAWELPDGANRIRPRLGNIRRIIAITGHGSSKLVNMAEGESGKRTVTRSMRATCSWRTRTTWCALYGLDTSTAEQRDAFLERVERVTAHAR
jgi:putative NADPH-quinone reductase